MHEASKTFPRNVWRLLYTPVFSGAWNMAVDEAILEAVGRRETPPTLRFFAWEPPCLSLGLAQPVADVSLEALKKRGWDLVRRPTGGRAILHADELTYSVCGPATDPRLAGGVLESYRILSQALLRGLQILGIEAEARGKLDYASPEAHLERRVDQPPVCFEVPSDYEITVNSRKLIGSAQARRGEGVLQHGSLPLSGELSRVIQVLNFPSQLARDEAAQRLLARAITVEQVLGKPISWEGAVQAFVIAFQETLNLEFQETDLTQGELTRAESLVMEKFTNWGWTGRV